MPEGIQEHFGNVLMTDGGEIALDCCCAPEEPSSCSNGHPEILGTLFDADYAGGNVTWAGETWTPAEIQAGTTKILCPRTYQLKQVRGTAYPYLGAYSFYYGVEKWGGASPPGEGLYMRRDFNWLTSQNVLAGKWSRYAGANYGNRAVLYGPASSGFIFYGATTPATTVPPMNPPQFTTSGPTNTWVFTASTVLATANDYRIKDNWFGSATVGGILYTWARGNGW